MSFIMICMNVQADPGHTQLQKSFSKHFKKLHRDDEFNGVVLVAHKNQILYEGVLGIAGPDARPLQKNSIFNLASVSKQFTALAILILSSQGQLTLKDPVQKFIPEIQIPGLQIQHLVYHTGGLADYENFLEDHWHAKRYPTNQDVIQLFKQHRPASYFLPGTKYQYSNTGYLLLASIVERASGQSFAAFIKSRIFQPAGMQHAYACPATLAKRSPLQVIGFTFENDQRIAYDVDPIDGVIGDGNICASAPDLWRYSRALRNGKILKLNHLKQAFQSGRLKNGRKVDYGFGWELAGSGTFISHTGSWVAFNTFFAMDLEDDLVFIALDNSDNENVGEQMEEVLEEFYD